MGTRPPKYAGINLGAVAAEAGPATARELAVADNFLKRLLANLPVTSGQQGNRPGITGADDLNNYFYLPGRPGGQKGHGGTQAGQNLWLVSTASGTRGKIILGGHGLSAYDDALDRLGIGTTTPASPLEVWSLAAGALTAEFYNDAGAGSSLFVRAPVGSGEPWRLSPDDGLMVEAQSGLYVGRDATLGEGSAFFHATPDGSPDITGTVDVGGLVRITAGAAGADRALDINTNSNPSYVPIYVHASTTQSHHILVISTSTTYSTTSAYLATFDEDARLGLRIAAPTARLHAVGRSAAFTDIVPTSTISVGTGNWQDQLGNRVDFHSPLAAPSTADFVQNTPLDSSTFEVKLAAITDPSTNVGWSIQLIAQFTANSAGSESIVITAFSATTSLFSKTVSNGVGFNYGSWPSVYSISLSSGEAAQIRAASLSDIRFRVNAGGLPGGTVPKIAHLALQTPAAGAGEEVVGKFVRGTGQTLDILQILSQDGTTRLSGFDANGHLLLADTSANAITHAPAASVTAHTLTWPGAQGAANTFLKNDGAGALSWANNILLDAAIHSDTASGAVVRGDIITGQIAAPNTKWTRLVKGTANQMLMMDATATDVAWRDQSAIDHGSLGGLADDDHPQYLFNNAGRTTPQVLIGGTGSAANLVLKSTSHATKGKIVLGNAGTSAYNEANDRFGVGTNAPGAKVEASPVTALETAIKVGGVFTSVAGMVPATAVDISRTVGDASSGVDSDVLINLSQTVSDNYGGPIVGLNLNSQVSGFAGDTVGTEGAHGLSFFITGTGAYPLADIQGVFGVADLDGTATVGLMTGFTSSVNKSGGAGGTVMSAFNFFANSSISSAGTIGTLALFRGTSPAISAGSITTIRGLWLSAMAGGGTNHALYCEGGQSYHAGKFGLNVVAPSAAMLDVLMDAAATRGIRLKQAATPTVNAWEVQDSSANVMASVDKDGILRGKVAGSSINLPATIVGASVDLVNQGAVIGLTTLWTAPRSGMYRINVYLWTHTIKLGDSCYVEFGWNDGVASRLISTATVQLIANNYACEAMTGIGSMYVASGQNITYQVFGTLTTGKFNLSMRVEAI